MQTKYLVTPDAVTLMHRTFETNQKRGKTAFVSHSQAQHTLNLRAFMQGLHDKGWRVHATDLRGHGYSSSERAPLGHMDMNTGWPRLIADMRLGLETAFDGIAFEDRLIVAPNIGALLVLQVLREWPDLAKHIVLVTPPPNQPTILKLARSFMKARSLLHPADKPDELTLHQLYTFLGARLKDRKHLIDVVSSDRAITDALLKDPYAWPTPTTGYFHEMFRGIEDSWKWPTKSKIAPDTNFLIIYGGDDPMTANGNFVGPMRDHLRGIGADQVDSFCVQKGRSGLFVEEERLGISKIVDNWVSGDPLVDQSTSATDMAGISHDVLTDLGLNDLDRDLTADELVELCYHAIDDENRWVEMLYRVAYAIASDDKLGESDLEAIVLALMPHADRSFKLNQQIMQSAAIGAVLQNVIERFSIGIAVVNADLKVSYANAMFLQNYAQITGQVIEAHGDYALLNKSLSQQYEPDFAARCRLGNGEALFVVDGEAVGFHFRPQSLRQTALQRDGASGVLIIRQSHTAKKTDSDTEAEKIELLQFAYGLTAKEAQAALGLLDGLSPDAIAKKFDVSINTTRTHLKRIYEKIGVQGQTELTARLLKGPIGLITT